MSHSYSPLTKLLYVFARDERRVFTKNTIRHAAEENNAAPTSTSARRAGAAEVRHGNGIFGAGRQSAGGARRRRRGRARFAPEESWGKVVAIDPLSGEIKWEHKVISPPWGGVMSTAGNLVFGGTPEGVVFALDGRTGERLVVLRRQRASLCFADQLSGERKAVHFARCRRRFADIRTVIIKR